MQRQPWLGGHNHPPTQSPLPGAAAPSPPNPCLPEQLWAQPGLRGELALPIPPGPLSVAAWPHTPCSAHTCIYFYSFSHFFRCHLCKYQLSSDTKKLLTLYKYHIYILYI